MSTELKYCISSLRHLYANMMHNVVDGAQAKRIATGLLGPTIERLEKLSALESAPAGWKLVPIEPTEEMLKAGQ